MDMHFPISFFVVAIDSLNRDDKRYSDVQHFLSAVDAADENFQDMPLFPQVHPFHRVNGMDGVALNEIDKESFRRILITTMSVVVSFFRNEFRQA